MAQALVQPRHMELHLGNVDGSISKEKTSAVVLDGATAEDLNVHCEKKPLAHSFQVPRVQHRPGQVGGAAGTAAAMLMALLPPLQVLRPTCQQLSAASVPSKQGTITRKRVVGTLFGQRKGRAFFAVQDDPSSEDPLLLVELAVATGQLVKEMASGTVRILLECERQPPDAKKNTNTKKKNEQIHQQAPAALSPPRAAPLWEEPTWTMFCNGRRCGNAMTRSCADTDRNVLRAVRPVSAGAGVLPPAVAAAGMPNFSSKAESTIGKREIADENCGEHIDRRGNQEMMYMRTKFERVVVSKDSEAFYMMSPSGSKAGSPELSIFLRRS